MMNAIGSFLLITALSIPTSTLVLRSGERIAVDGQITVEDRTILFHSGGALYSIPAEEVDLDATRAGAQAVALPLPNHGRLKLSADEREKLLRDLEENHSGTAPPPGALAVPPPTSPAEREAASRDEWFWRHQTEAYQEAIRRAQENLDLLKDKADKLRERINFFFVQGYKPFQFSYDTTQLAYTLDSIPNAELQVRRAQRAYDQFLDDARRQGIPPGWVH